MVNSDEFSKRLKTIFDYYDLSASSFADKIDVGRASISHILSGRNKPSLDFVMKVVSTFDEVELYWLLNGKGNFPASENEKEDLNFNQKEATGSASQAIQDATYSNRSGKTINRVIIFYDDGSFESYENYPKSR